MEATLEMIVKNVSTRGHPKTLQNYKLALSFCHQNYTAK